MIIHFSNNTNNQARPIGAKNWIKRIQPVFHSMLSPRNLNECFNSALHMRAGNGISFNSVLYYTRLAALWPIVLWHEKQNSGLCKVLCLSSESTRHLKQHGREHRWHLSKISGLWQSAHSSRVGLRGSPVLETCSPCPGVLVVKAHL